LSIGGSFKELRELSKRLGDLTKGDALQQIANAAANESLTQLNLGFRASRDPYGNPWRPLKYRQGQPLRDTRRMQSAWDKQVTARGFRLFNRTPYTRFHQYGTQGRNTRAGKRVGAIPARPMVPRGNDMGTWAEPVRKAMILVLRRLVKGG